MWDSLKDLQMADKILVDKVNTIEILIAGNYMSKVDLENSSVSQASIISNSGWINDLTTNIAQNSIIQSTGWITDTITNLEKVLL